MVWKKHLKKVWMYLRYPYDWCKEEIEFRKRLKELKKRDPFIYE